MANIRNEGLCFDAGLVINTGITITAGSLIWADVSGTNVVHAVRAYSGVTPESNITAFNHLSGTGRGFASLDTQFQSGVFLGVIARTQTGVAGSQTGVTWYSQGVFRFSVTPSASSNVLVGRPVYAITHDTVRAGSTGIDAGANLTSTTASGSNTTGTTPIGVVSRVIGGGFGQTWTTTTGTALNYMVDVKIYPHRTLQSYT